MDAAIWTFRAATTSLSPSSYWARKSLARPILERAIKSSYVRVRNVSGFEVFFARQSSVQSSTGKVVPLCLKLNCTTMKRLICVRVEDSCGRNETIIQQRW